MNHAVVAGEPLVRIERLVHRIGQRTILDIPEWQFLPGEHALLLGPSGSGKTSLINLVAGLISPTAGQVVLAGQNLALLPPSGRDELRRRTVGLVFQTLRLVSALTVRQNLLLAQKIGTGTTDAKEVDRLIARVGLLHRADAKPRALSQGEGQRAAIARALVTRPALVIADEPTSALDDENTAAMADLLFTTAAASGATLLVATHDARIRDRFPNRLLLTSDARSKVQ